MANAESVLIAFCLQRVGLRNRISITMRYAKIFRQVSCNKCLKHEIWSTVCLVVNTYFASDDVGLRSSSLFTTFCDTDLCHYLGAGSEMGCESFLSVLPT